MNTFSRRAARQRRARAAVLAACALVAAAAAAAEFTVTQIANDKLVNREPVVSDTGLVAWYAFEKGEAGEAMADIYIHQNGALSSITKGVFEPGAANFRPQVQGNSVVWQTTLPSPAGDVSWVMREVPQGPDDPPELDASYEAAAEPDGAGGSLGRQWFIGRSTNQAPPDGSGVITNISRPVRHESGDTEICLWDNGGIIRLTEDTRHDVAPSHWGRLVAWQKAKGWPFGWEIMARQDDFQIQLTTNYYYDMAPKVHGSQVTWYGWDGNDFEIYLYDKDQDTITQITSNLYDDVSPVIWDGVIAWEAYSAVEADIFMWKDGEIRKLSDNVEDDVNPRIWNGRIVWQGFDGDDFEIYLFDGDKTTKLTSNNYDDLNPDIGDGFVTWMGYHDNWDAEIFVWDGNEVTRLTDNDYEDRDPRTAGRRVVWQAAHDDKSEIYLAVPK